MANVTSHSLQEQTKQQQSQDVPSLAEFTDLSAGTSPRQYMGEPWARQLIAWLERNQLKAKGKRIVELLREMSAAAGMVQPDWTLDAQWGMTCELRKGAVDPTFTAFQQLHASINRRLSRYRLYPEVWFGRLDRPSGWQVSWRSSRKQTVHSGVDDSESSAIGLLLNLARRGVVDRVRECLECKCWFFARFEHSKFCQQKCQVKHYQSDPKWKTHRRDWMRSYRDTLKRRQRIRTTRKLR